MSSYPVLDVDLKQAQERCAFIRGRILDYRRQADALRNALTVANNYIDKEEAEYRKALLRLQELRGEFRQQENGTGGTCRCSHMASPGSHLPSCPDYWVP